MREYNFNVVCYHRNLLKHNSCDPGSGDYGLHDTQSADQT